MLQNCGWELEHGTWNYSDCATTLTFRGNLSVPNWAEWSRGVVYSCKLRWLNKHSFSRREGGGWAGQCGHWPCCWPDEGKL